jgi:flavin-dependent dehydrogenase
VDVGYDRPVSFGIRRSEFDHYLLSRSGARLATGEPVRELRRDGRMWVVNDRYRAPVLVGAGGHFCPVAQHLNGPPGTGPTVAAQESEFAVENAGGSSAYATPGERPELYFSPDFRGYGWCFRKEAVMNIGFGSLDRRALPRAVRSFVEFLRAHGRIGESEGRRWHGHAYRLYEPARRRVVDDGVVLVGDAAGLAYPESGEGIRPAIESGLMAAAAIVGARGSYAATDLARYGASLRAHFGAKSSRTLRPAVPPAVLAALGRGLMRAPWFVRHVVLDRWFLHSLA